MIVPEHGDHAVIGRRSLRHYADHFAFQAGDIFQVGPRIDREAIGRHDQRDVNELRTTQNRIDDRSAGGRHIDVAGDQRLGQPGAAGDINILHIEAVFFVQLRFLHHPQRKLRAARLRITDAHRDRRRGGETHLRRCQQEKQAADN